MIEASFERGAAQSAAVSGAYQYDTGQRLRIYGLPSPGELALEDEFLSGDMITMQVHFGMKGDSQTQARLALWENEKRCWLASIPDEYLQSTESVYAYIYVSHGLDENGNGRAKTMYELTFRPIARPAPNHVATGEQWEAWAVKQAEMDLTIDALHGAAQAARDALQRAQETMQAAQEAQENAQKAADEAQQQAKRMEAVRQGWAEMKLRTVMLQAGAEATAEIRNGVVTLGIPRGAEGTKGEAGDEGTADITLSMADGILTIAPRG